MKLKSKEIETLVESREEFKRLAENCSIELRENCWHPKRYQETGDWWCTSNDYDYFHWYKRTTRCNACYKTLVTEVRSDTGDYKKTIHE